MLTHRTNDLLCIVADDLKEIERYQQAIEGIRMQMREMLLSRVDSLCREMNLSTLVASNCSFMMCKGGKLFQGKRSKLAAELRMLCDEYLFSNKLPVHIMADREIPWRNPLIEWHPSKGFVW